MNKPSKPNVKNLASKKQQSNSIVVTWTNEEWDEPAISAHYVNTHPHGGLFGIGQHLWSAAVLTEDSCCGFPVLSNFGEKKLTDNQCLTIGIKLSDLLVERVTYMSAYVPNLRQFANTRKILKEAGFIAGVTLQSNNKKGYTNTRWEWFSPIHKEGKDAKNLCTLPV